MRVFTPQIGREVEIREDGSDYQVWADTFTGLYHVPPPEMPAPRTVLDLGANIGLTAAHYQHLWPEARIVAYEMDAESAALAAVNAHAATVRAEAVSDRPGMGGYLREGVLAEAYRIDDERPGEPEPVMCSTLREIILRWFGREVDFVKMDVEGMEWRLFDEGTWAPLVRHLVVELHGGEGSDQAVAVAIYKLTRLGFEARRHPPHPRAVYARR